MHESPKLASRGRGVQQQPVKPLAYETAEPQATLPGFDAVQPAGRQHQAGHHQSRKRIETMKMNMHSEPDDDKREEEEIALA